MLLTLLCFALFAAATAPGAAGADECVRCHQVLSPKIAAEHAGSVHAAAEVACADCHGGDRTATTKEAGHSKEKGYRGSIPRAEVPDHCASCHSDVNKMKFFRLDTNVLAEWKTSRHGKLFAEGDPRAADCTRCHGTHGIRPGRDPKSRTHRQNVSSTCGECHSHAEKMGSSKLPTNQEAQYVSGVHGQVLAGKRTGNADLVPTCVDCHGVHGASPPDAQTVPAVCGHCHFEERRYLAKSPHHAALRATGAPSCVTCHGSHHNSIPESGGLVAETCGTCHKSAGDQGIVVAKRFVELMARARATEESVARIAGANDSGLSEKTRRLLHAEQDRLRSAYRDVRSRSHALDVADLERSVVGLEGIVRTAKAVASDDPETDRGFSRTTVILIVAGVGVLIVAASIGIAWLLLKIYRRLPKASGPESPGKGRH